ncbi:mediator of RNA polymerase II transcription subunit 4 [Impatiens glandulifera]|uniref:mediator of RNA polymerase II transcription subunit 4 n=1 Tax=Impatiens glandulifera TaxID=253017 RepID=UPI001FB14A66|nr:mediator of RNA polymerase II transcription subunit 4 [Impatiens glandulifera]
MLQNVQHQIAQSPARLGLSSPNSPSLQNSTNPPRFSSQIQQSQQSSQPLNTPTTTTTTITTSSTLLPLLPPLPRAQSLLNQMAALSSRIFEVSSNRPHWISSFRGSLPTFLSSQTQSLKPNPNEPSPSTTKQAISAFSSLQTQLVEAVSELQEILDLQDAKQKITREIQSKDTTIRNFANKLRLAEQVLDNLVDDYSDYIRPKRLKPNDQNPTDATTTTISTQLNLNDILSYAHTISYTTFAPPEFGAGTAPLRGALPPAPQDEQLRASQLYAFSDLDIGLPKAIREEPIIESKQQQEASQLGNLASVTGLIPPNIVVPSGWKPGMPVELPSDLPIVPPGWKPGDPIPLPPLDGVHASGMGRVEQQQVITGRAQVFPKAQESINVRHVKLDIDEGESSDYSSDSESSDDEED